jgi:hypothetical protein
MSKKKNFVEVLFSLPKMAIGKVVEKGLIVKKKKGIAKYSLYKSSNKFDKCLVRICR